MTQHSTGTGASTAPLIESFLDLPPALEDRNLARLRPEYEMLIGGDLRGSVDGRTFETFNPATGELLARVPYAAASDVDAAVRAARLAFPTWAAMAPLERGKMIFRLARRVAERSRSLAVLETMDGGKPIREARDVDVPLAAQHLFHHAGWADKLAFAGVGPAPAPLGVVAQIVPWNFPLLMCAWKIAPALACGNTVVLKPAETTSLTALELASLCAEVGFPPGVVNVVTGPGDVGSLLAQHKDVDKIAFTGSTEVGRLINRTAAARGIPLTLELGGKSANIVFRDADLDAAAEGVMDAIFFNQGHVCCAGSRLLVEESCRDEFLDLLAARLRRIRVGDPLDKNTEVGAINSPEQLARITDMVEGTLARGASRVSAEFALPRSGCFYPPTVLYDVDASDPIARDEVFGPVLTVMSFRTTQEAVDLANNTPYGLAAGVWSQRPEKIFAVVSQLRAGVVWANTYNKFDPTAAFGGFKESGFGREGGRSGLEAYCG